LLRLARLTPIMSSGAISSKWQTNFQATIET
jgi:hypothetical protein